MNRDLARAVFDKHVLPLLDGAISQWMICGSYRRGREEIKDLDVLLVGDDHLLVSRLEQSGCEWVVGRTVKPGQHHQIVRVKFEGLMIDMMFIPVEVWGAGAMHTTGPKELNIKQRFMAMKNGLCLSQLGLRDKDGRVVAAKTEEEVYAALGMKYLNPVQREAYAQSWAQAA